VTEKSAEPAPKTEKTTEPVEATKPVIAKEPLPDKPKPVMDKKAEEPTTSPKAITPEVPKETKMAEPAPKPVE